MLREKLELLPQKCEGNYLFSNVKALVTTCFMDEFGQETTHIINFAQSMILDTYENPDWLQVFRYGDKKILVCVEL